ncbi:DUF4242 domain-containing protein [Mycolicibacterium sp. ELW1]|uniref:DUF4242 domain-containing protein n=1 Tax=Mycobacteriaceae TaxID=1762 RepID=UPI0011EC0969|nr:DUF4242 domain-containing protein [Mycobacterium sp. ELW1]QEN14800.1 DUF4242 domain-containing protein [Mycobacterium sp. ELW1]
MPLHLYEINAVESDTDHVLKEIDALTHRLGGELIEVQITTAQRIFAVAEFENEAPTLDSAALGGAEITGPHQVRLVGAALEDLKAVRPAAGYLAEWDLPAELDMDSYLARKKANAPRYADVPEVSFLRTYVREDMDKCLCFYNAPDEEAVRRARDAVSTPIDRLHRLDEDRR